VGTARQVFFDPSGRRERMAILAGYCVLLGFLSVILGLFAAIAAMPVLPPVTIAEDKRQTLFDAETPGSTPAAEPIDLSRNRTVSPAVSASVRRFAFYVNWDERSFTSLKKNAASFDTLIAEWLHLDGASGSIRRDGKDRERELRGWLRRHAPALEIVPLVNNYNSESGRWDGEAAAGLFASSVSRARLIEQLLAYVQDGKFPGITLDFEQIPAGHAKRLTVFVRELADRFFPLGLRVLTAVPFSDAGIEYEEIASASSQVILMAYDEHDETAERPGPIASQGWFEAKLEKRMKQTGRQKTIVALGSYGYDWKTGSRGSTISVQQAWDLADAAGAKVSLDAASLNPFFAYLDIATGQRHEVWFGRDCKARNRPNRGRPRSYRFVARCRRQSKPHCRGAT
jgi:spore germination protein YaaH